MPFLPRTWRLRLLESDVELSVGATTPTKAARAESEDVLRTLRFEGLGKRHPALRGALAALGPITPSAASIDDRLATAVRFGALTLRRVERRRIIHELPGSYLGPDLDPPDPQPKPPAQHWVIVDVVDGKNLPVAGVRYVLTLPGDAIRYGSTDQDGRIRETEIDQTGDAKLVFPERRPFRDDEPPKGWGSPYSDGQNGVSVPIDDTSVVELPPDTYRARLIGMFFDSDKCFLLPGAMHGIRALRHYYDAHPTADLLAVGHTDSVGAADWNLTLSVERAESMKAFLTDDVGGWMKWFGQGVHWRKRWSVREVQLMLTALPEKSPDPYYVGDPTSWLDARTRAALKRFQTDNGLNVTGKDDDATRKAIVTAYMALEGTSLPEGASIQTHGCGKFHQAIPTADGVAEAQNRRVEIFMFEGGVEPAPAKCGAPGCSQYEKWLEGVVETRDFHLDGDLSIPVTAARPESLCSPRKTFPKPSMINTLSEIASRAAADPAVRVVVMGNTDAMGDPGTDYALSLARAEAVKAFLTKDKAFFRQRFEEADPLEPWGWEEIQWMLTAIHHEEGSPLYGGMVDGHRGATLLTAIQAFKIVASLDLRPHMDDEALDALIQAYLDTIGPTPVDPLQVFTVGGGSWHPPRQYGDGGKPLEGPEYSSNELPDFRRTEIFLSRVPLDPPVEQCATSMHATCEAYDEWCDQVVEEIVAIADYSALVHVVDELARPVAGVDVVVESIGDTDLPGAFTTSEYGIAKVIMPRGLYSARVDLGSDADGVLLDRFAVLDLRFPDQQGGATIRVPNGDGA